MGKLRSKKREEANISTSLSLDASWGLRDPARLCTTTYVFLSRGRGQPRSVPSGAPPTPVPLPEPRLGATLPLPYSGRVSRWGQSKRWLCASPFLPSFSHSWIQSHPFVGWNTFYTYILSIYLSIYLSIPLYLYLCLVTITLDHLGIPGKRFSSLMSPKVYHRAIICLSWFKQSPVTQVIQCHFIFIK